MSDADIEVLPGFNRADVKYLAECLEGQHGVARVVESAEQAAKFIRAALAVTEQLGPLPRKGVSVPVVAAVDWRAAGDLLAALEVSRGQWIHSVNAAQCLAAIKKATGKV